MSAEWIGCSEVGEWSLRRCDRERSAIRKALAEESEAVRFCIRRHYYRVGRRRMVWSRRERWWIGIIARQNHYTGGTVTGGGGFVYRCFAGDGY